MSEDALSRADRVCRLLDIYGGLLTDLQRRYCEQHFAEDLSFGEIAREQNISRQAVHDTVKNALALLDNYEEHLGLVALEDGAADGASDSSATPDEPGQANQEPAITAARLAAAREALTDLSREIRQRGGVIYDGHAFARQLEEIEGLLTPEN